MPAPTLYIKNEPALAEDWLNESKLPLLVAGGSWSYDSRPTVNDKRAKISLSTKKQKPARW